MTGSFPTTFEERFRDLVKRVMRLERRTSGTTLPSGMLMPSARQDGEAPAGWLLCDGSYVLRATYPQLFAAIGTFYGTTTADNFRLPDIRGRSIVGVNPGDPDYGDLNDAGGAKTHTHQHISPIGMNTGRPVVFALTDGNLDLKGTYAYDGAVITNGAATIFPGSSQNLERWVVTSTASSSLGPYRAFPYLIKT